MATRMSTPRFSCAVCGADADAAEQRHRRELEVLAVGPDRRLDLRGELARRRRGSARAAACATPARVRRRPVDRRCSIGSTKPAVLPVPVCAPARRSPPARTAGMACAWMGVGRYSLASATARNSASDSPRVEKDMNAFEWVLGHSPPGKRPVTAKRRELRRSESTAARGLEQAPRRHSTLVCTFAAMAAGVGGPPTPECGGRRYRRRGFVGNVGRSNPPTRNKPCRSAPSFSSS